MERKELGKISKARFGFCGYQEAMFGLALTFEGKGWGVCSDITGGWSEQVQWSNRCQWTEEDRTRQRAEMCKRVDATLTAAKVDSVDKLVGKPVEITFDGNALKEWRILEEVI